jgi:peptide/nickel transport system permease protein
VPTLFGITLISFLLMLATPGDPIALITFRSTDLTAEDLERTRRQLGLDQPALTQYAVWLIGNDWTMIDVDGDGTGDIAGTRRGLLRGDLGNSIQQRRPVMDLLVERVPATLQLTVPALLLGYLVGVPLGIAASISKRVWVDQAARLVSVLGIALPSFWLALILIIIFGVSLKWLPISGMRDLNNPNASALDNLRYMIMPVTVLSMGTIATISRFTRTKMLEVMGEDYIRTARAKGLNQRTIWWRHAFRNALLPIVTFLGPALGFLLGGAVIIETIFSWPGMGRLITNAMFARDYPVVMGSVIFSAVLYIFGLLVSDILYSVVDPRIRLK